MTHNEKYLFDLNGYLVVEDALSAEEVATFNAILDEKLAAHPEPDKTTYRFGRLLSWGQPFLDLIANPRILPHLHTMVGERCRLDHDYLDVIRAGLGPIGATLHGGGHPHNPLEYYLTVQGQMYNGLVVVAYALKDTTPEDGGFACVPGSHKANYYFPPEWRNMEETLAPVVKPVPAKAGSAVLFTEALMHGTLPWRGKDERRTIFYKYSPHFMSWSARYYNPTDYPDLPLEVRRMLEPPNSRHSNRPTEVKE